MFIFLNITLTLGNLTAFFIKKQNKLRCYVKLKRLGCIDIYIKNF